MNLKVAFSVISILVCNVISPSMSQVEREFIDKANGFKITLAEGWRAVPYTDAVGRQKTEFVYEDRTQGLLRIAKANPGGASLQAIVRREIDDFTLCYSCVYVSQEAFAGGSMTGIRVTLYYLEGERRIVGTFYFLQEKEAVWILRFNGRAGSAGMAREITDTMAGSFCSVCAFL